MRKLDKERLYKICRTARSSSKLLTFYALHCKVVHPSRCTESGTDNDWTSVELSVKIITHLN